MLSRGHSSRGNMRALKKPVTLEYRRIHEPCAVKVCDVILAAEPGQILLTTSKGVKSLIGEAEFEKDYEFVGVDTGYCWSIPKIVQLKVLDRGYPYDYMLILEDGTTEVVDRELFEKTYDILEK